MNRSQRQALSSIDDYFQRRFSERRKMRGLRRYWMGRKIAMCLRCGTIALDIVPMFNKLPICHKCILDFSFDRSVKRQTTPELRLVTMLIADLRRMTAATDSRHSRLWHPEHRQGLGHAEAMNLAACMEAEEYQEFLNRHRPWWRDESACAEWNAEFQTATDQIRLHKRTWFVIKAAERLEKSVAPTDQTD